MHRREPNATPRRHSRWLSLRGELLGVKLSFRLLLLYRLCRKAEFDPDQPRHPKGVPEGGRWSGTDGAAKPSRTPRPDSDPKTPPKSPRLRPPGIGHNRPPRTSVPQTPLDPPPEIPKSRPLVKRKGTWIAKDVAKWILRAAAKRALGPIGLLIDVIEVVGWMQEHYPAIETYFEGPKTLEELRSLAKKRLPGYEIHHIVEKTPASDEGFPSSMIEGYDNLVRVPQYRHHEINGWYSSPNDEFGGQTPRDYLRGKPWSERMRVGLDALELFEVIEK